MAVIFHLDLDSFFVSAERLRRPELRGQRVVVGYEGPRGVVASCSYEARKFGVRSAMPIAQALRICPGVVVCHPDHDYYAVLSERVFARIREFTPVFEAVSVDEGYLDMTGTAALFGPPREAAARLRARILAETGLIASVGIAGNRLVAKVATDFCKPDGLLEIEPGREAEFLAPLSVRSLPGCGKVTHEWLNARGIFTVRELQRQPLNVLERHLGKFGAYLHESAWGRGSTAFHEEAQTRSASREMTFDGNVGDVEELKRNFWSMCADLGRGLRAAGDFAHGVRVKLRYPPFETVLRSRVLSAPTQSDQVLYDAVLALFAEHWDQGRPLRLIGAGCVLGDGARQLGLFEDHRAEARRDRLEKLKDELREKFGEKAIGTGQDLPRR